MLLDLPQDISFTILGDWLGAGVRQLSVLDVAFCNHSIREDWLLTLPHFKLKHMSFALSLYPLLAWLYKRRVYFVAATVLKLKAVNALENADLTKFSFPRTRKITFPYDRDVVYPDEFFPDCNVGATPFGICSFLSLFPNLTSFTTADCWPKHHLLELLQLRWKLKELVVGGVDGYPCVFAALVVQVSSTLESLECLELDNWGMLKVSKCCRRLKKLATSVGIVFDFSTVRAVCSANPNLEHIDFSTLFCQRKGNAPSDVVDGEPEDEFDMSITTKDMERVALLCPKLKRLILDRNNRLEYHFIPFLIANCRHLKQVHARGVKMTIMQYKGRKCCNVLGIHMLENAVEVLENIPLPIVHFGLEKRKIHVNCNVLQRLGDKHSSSLESVHLCLEKDVLKEHMAVFCKICPNLTIISLSGVGRKDTVYYKAD